MPIQKESGARLVRFGYHFETIPRESVEQLTNPVALAYWTYLLTRPDDWVVRRSQLMERFGVGRDRHDAAMAQLKAAGLVWVQVDRDAAGQFTDRRIMVGAIPADQLPSPKVCFPTIRENPQVGKTGRLKKDILLKDKHIPLKGGRFIPPTVQQVADYCQEYGCTVDPVAFVDFYTCKDWMVGKNKMKDYRAAVRTWARRDQAKQQTDKTSTRRTSLREDLEDTSWAR